MRKQYLCRVSTVLPTAARWHAACYLYASYIDGIEERFLQEPRPCACPPLKSCRAVAFRHTARAIPTRVQDIRATEVDKAEVSTSLCPGDIIRARVISLGDSTQYFLSTAENELGVRWAKSAAGAIMIPISWQVRRRKTDALWV